MLGFIKHRILEGDCVKTGYRGETIEINGNVDSFSTIGEYTYIGLGTNVTKTVIGRYVSIGSDCAIGYGEHKTDWISTSHWIYKDRVDWYSILTKGNVIIENDVWIGTQSIIRRGITIHNGAIVGANSFVNKDVPEFSIVAGSPAKIIGKRFDDNIVSMIKDSHWWDYEQEQAIQIIERLEKRLGINIQDV